MACQQALPHAGVLITAVFLATPSSAARQVYTMVVRQQAFTRPYFIATGTPPELVATLRAAFDATMRDPQFLSDADKMRIDISPLPGGTVQELVGKLYATPKAVVEQARAAIRP